jgi:lactate dehydrogenase-like 2-hydroxyacid dehydrogenase
MADEVLWASVLPGTGPGLLREAGVAVREVAGIAPIAGLDPAVRDAVRVLLTNAGVGCDAATMNLLPRLGAVVSLGAGMEKLDAAAAAARGIAVQGLGDYLTEDVADLAMAQLVVLSRRLREAEAWVRERRWGTAPWPVGRGLAGRRMGLLGYGRIGQAIARRAVAAGMEIAAHTPRRREDVAWFPDARSLAASVDVLVLACPGGRETRHAIGAAELTALGPEGVLVNIARGSVVDEAALIAALTAGTIAGAALDVFEGEPKPDAALLACPNLVVSPHLGGATREARARATRMATEAILRHLGRLRG